MFLRTLPALAIGLFFGFVMMQAPEYLQQYKQNLNGAINALESHVVRFDQNARSYNLSREEALNEYLRARSPFLHEQGVSMRKTITRYETLKLHYEAMQEATLFQQPFVFLSGMDREIASAAMDIYKPALPTTPEGLMYGAVGFFLGQSLIWLLFGAFRFILPRRRRAV